MNKRLKTAILSYDKAAYFGAAMLMLEPVGNFIDKALSKMLSSKFKENQSELPTLLFIVGPPRSGTTVIYQTLVRLIPSVYFSNLHQVLPHFASLFLGDSLGRFNAAKSFYGYTYGWAGVNECNKVLRYISANIGNAEQTRQRFVEFLRSMQGKRQRPVLVKNVRSYDKLSALMDINPEIKVVQVHRDLCQTAQSVYRAYQQLGYFAPVPANLTGQLETLGPHRFTVELIKAMENQLNRQKQHIGSERWFDLRYEDFCERPYEFARQISRFMGNDDLKINDECTVNLKPSDRQKIFGEDFDKLKSACSKYN